MGWKALRGDLSTRRARPAPQVRFKGDLESQMQQARVLMHGGNFDAADALMEQIQRKWPKARHRLDYYRIDRRLLAGDVSPEFWHDAWPISKRTLVRREMPLTAPLWDGEPIPGQTLLIWTWANLGLGDLIQWARILAAAKQQSQAHVVLEVLLGMTRLLRTLQGPDALVELGEEPVACDAQCPLLLLLGIVPLTPTILAGCPYLAAEPEVVSNWAPTFADRATVHIGLHWQAETRHVTGPSRSLRLADLAPIFDLPHTRFYSLQYDGSNEFKSYPEVVDLGHVDHPNERFVETAGIMQHLDLVLATDSALGHVAGALGVPCWLLMRTLHDPRWGALQCETPWYPAHRLRSAVHAMSWAELVEDLRDELQGVVPRVLARRGIVCD
jgi:hypothetical protein